MKNTQELTDLIELSDLENSIRKVLGVVASTIRLVEVDHTEIKAIEKLRWLANQLEELEQEQNIDEQSE